MRALVLLGVASTFIAGTAFAQEEQPAPPPQPPADPAPVVAPAPPPPAPPPPAPAPVETTVTMTTDQAEKPAEVASGPRDHGIRLGLDLGFARATSSEGSGLLTTGSPSLIPINVDVSWRIGQKTLVGLHGWAALASRDNCAGTDCTARSYGIGPQIEAGIVHADRFDLWFRYAAGFELLYQGGFAGNGAGHLYRDAFDVADLRLGGDFVLSRNEQGKTIKVGPYVGANLGILISQSGSTGPQSKVDLDSSGGDPHLWLSLGVRATFDP